MRVSFIKMHGLGNDFVILDGRDRALPALATEHVRALADRRTGIGCDQLIVLEPSDKADFRMRILNADGGEVEACGNATRAVGLLHGEHARIETVAGVLIATPSDSGVAVEMGQPRFDWQTIPLAYAMDTHAMPLAWEELVQPIAVNVGNPHAVFFVPDCDTIDLERLGPMIETDHVFPERINVNVASIVDRHHLRLRVWERGTGLTRACGTGACASAVAAIRRGLADSPVQVDLPGGSLRIDWREDDTIVMTGPASVSFRGSFEAGDFGIAA